MFYQIVFSGCSLALRKKPSSNCWNDHIACCMEGSTPNGLPLVTAPLNLSPGPGPELDGGWYLGPEYLCCYPLHQRPA